MPKKVAFQSCVRLLIFCNCFNKNASFKIWLPCQQITEGAHGAAGGRGAATARQEPGRGDHFRRAKGHGFHSGHVLQRPVPLEGRAECAGEPHKTGRRVQGDGNLALVYLYAGL